MGRPNQDQTRPRSRLTSARWRLLGAGWRVECAKVRSSAKTLALRIWLGRACALLPPDTSCAGLHEAALSVQSCAALHRAPVGRSTVVQRAELSISCRRIFTFTTSQVTHSLAMEALRAPN